LERRSRSKVLRSSQKKKKGKGLKGKNGKSAQKKGTTGGGDQANQGKSLKPTTSTERLGEKGKWTPLKRIEKKNEGFQRR